MPSSSKDRITVKKTLHVKDAEVIFMAYMSPARPLLTETLLLRGKREGEIIRRVSKDSGRNWVETGSAIWEEQRNDRLVTRTAAALHSIEDAGVLVEFLNESEARLNEGITFGPEAGTHEYLEYRTNRILYRFSHDEGKSWSAVKQLVQKGKRYDAVHWAEGVWHGKNSAWISPATRPIRLRDGVLLLPVYCFRLDENGAFLRWPDRFGDVTWPAVGAACFRGEWNTKRCDFDWEMSSLVTAPEYVTRELDECEIAEVDDGKLMMIIRGNASAWQSISGVKFFAISRDEGRTWGPPVPLTYPDGSFAHSPASLPNLFRSSKNGKLYLIANIVPEICRQADPRYPLVIAEVDPKYFWVLPETVTVIENRQPHHPNGVRFSNWQRIEDRKTRNPVIFMTEAGYDSVFPNTKGTISPHSYRYEIILPD